MRRVPSQLLHKPAVSDTAEIERTIMRYRIHPLTRNVVRPALLAAVILSLATAALLVIGNVQADRWLALLPLLTFVAIEAIYTTQWASHPKRLVLDHSLYRLTELFLLLLLARIVTWFLFQEGAFTVEQGLFYLRHPLSLFMTPGFLIAALLILGVWRLSIVLSRTFTQLDLSEFELRYYSQPLSVRKTRIDDQPIQIGRTELVQRFLRLWLFGGILLIIMVGLSTLDIASYRVSDSIFSIGRLGLRPAVLFALLVYFLGGFWLMSQARLSELNARWLINGVQKGAQVESNWQRYSLLALLLVALIAAFVPIGPTLPIARLLNYAIYGFMFLAGMAFYAVSLGMTLFLTLLSMLGGRQGEPAPLEPVQPPPMVPPQEQSSASETAAILASSAFWSVLVVVAIIALLYFLRERDERPERQVVVRLWERFKAWLRAQWDSLRARATAVRLELATLRPKRQKHADATASQPSRWRFIRVNALSPRDQIRYFYLSTVKRAGQRGVKRTRSETPLEYVDDLRSAWPDAEEELEELTDAFLWARYSPRPIEKEDAGLVKRTWQQVKSNMRRRRESDPSAGNDGRPPE